MTGQNGFLYGWGTGTISYDWKEERDIEGQASDFMFAGLSLRVVAAVALSAPCRVAVTAAGFAFSGTALPLTRRSLP